MTSIHTQPLRINLSPNSHGEETTLTIHCLSELTPVDMLDMSYGRADPTGCCVWLGAFLFIEMFAREFSDTDQNEMQKYWKVIREALFPPHCQVIELGSGTGMSSLSLILMSERSNEEDTDDFTDEKSIYKGPSLLVQTDNNDDALELCRINRDANRDKINRNCDVHVEKLEWGKDTTTMLDRASLPTTYHTVLATDVLYDLSSLVPLLTSAFELLKEDGYFILSHVPRAYIDEDENDSETTLETIIIKEAFKVGLDLAAYPCEGKDIGIEIIQSIKEQNNTMILRPSLLPHIFGDNTLSISEKHSWKRMIDAGGAVFVFQKKRSS